MKSNLIKYSFAALALVAAVSCSTRKEAADYKTDEAAILLDIHSTGGEDFSLQDKVNITCESGTIAYVRVASGWKPEGKAYFRWGPRTSELTFNAVYPAVSNATYARFYVPKSQNTVTSLAQADYSRGIVSHPVESPDGKLQILVDRVMAKVKFNISGLPDGERIQAFKVGSFNGLTDTTTVDKTACEINPFCIVPEGGVKGGNGCSYEACVCPGGASSSIVLFSYSLAGNTYSKKGLPKRESGKTYEYDVKITSAGYTVSEPKVY